MIDDLKRYMPEDAYADKELKILNTSRARTGQVINTDDKESLAADEASIIARADTYGNNDEKVIVTRLQDENGDYRLQSAFIPRFNKIGSVYSFSLIGKFIKDEFDNATFVNFLRFGEQQDFDTFLNCTKNQKGRFPLSLINVLPQGTKLREYLGVNYRQFQYYIESYLEALPNVFFGNVSNTGGTDLGFPLDAKSSFQVGKKSDVVFSLNEGSHITSGLYQYDLSTISRVYQWIVENNIWKDEKSLYSSCGWRNDIQSLISEPSPAAAGYLSSGKTFTISNGYYGWVSFWFDASRCDGRYLATELQIILHSLNPGSPNLSVDGYMIRVDSIFLEDDAYAAFYSDIDWSIPHRVTIRWNFIDDGNQLDIQLDDYEPVTVTVNTTAVALATMNFLSIFSYRNEPRIFGFCQSGDWFPWVHPESNKQYFLPFNLNLMEGLTGVIGPKRRDAEGFKNLYATQDELDDMEIYTVGNDIVADPANVIWVAKVTDNWDGTTIIHDIAELAALDVDGQVLYLADLNAAARIDIYAGLTISPVGKISFRIYPITGGVGHQLFFNLTEGGTVIGSIRIQMNNGNVFIFDNTVPGYVNSGLSVNLDAVNCISLEWTAVDKDLDANSPDYRVSVNCVNSSWYWVDNNWAVGVDRFEIETFNADNNIQAYIDDITYIYQPMDFAAAKEPIVSYPEGEFLNIQYLQRGVGCCRNPWVQFLDSSDNGFGKYLKSEATGITIDGHQVDEILALIPSSETNYRTSQWMTEDWINWWLPLGLSTQTHPKYSGLRIHNSWYDRYSYCYSTLSLITQIESMITANEEYENAAELEYTPLTHPFCKPNNIGYYFADNVAMPERFDKCPQRMRKEVTRVEENFGDHILGAAVSDSPYWTFAAAGTPTFEVDKFNKSLKGHFIDDDAANTADAFYTFPIASPTIPGYFTVRFKLTIVSGIFQTRLTTAGVGNNIQLEWGATGEGTFKNWGLGDVATGWLYGEEFEVIIEVLNGGAPSTFNVYILGVQYGPFNNTANWANPIARLRLFSQAAHQCEVYIDDINPEWEVYPNIDDDDFVIYPSYLGHARPIEVVGLDDQWGFRDYGKYTAVPNTHPTKFWVSFFLSAPYGNSESNGEIIFYDVAGAEMLYLQVLPLRAADLGNHPKYIDYASDSAETTTALTTIDGSWNGWIPISIEIDADNSKANIYYHCKLVAGDIDLNPGLEGFGWVTFFNGVLTHAIGMGGVWRDEDFQKAAYIEGFDITGDAQWAAGTAAVFTAHSVNGQKMGHWQPLLVGDIEPYAFVTASPAWGVNFAVKWEIMKPTGHSGSEYLIGDAGAANRVMIRCNQATNNIETNSAGWQVVAAYIDDTWHEIIVFMPDANNHYVIVDGITYGPWANNAAFAGVITVFTLDTPSAGPSDAGYIDNIVANWVDMEYSGTDIEGSLLIDAIQWSCDDFEHEQFRNYDRCDFRLPYRDFINPHLSTFYNNLNGPAGSDVIPLPPFNAVTTAYEPGDWTSAYWELDQYQAGIPARRYYGGIVKNWYLWNFPYVFGGDLAGTGLPAAVYSMIRLRHDVSVTDRQYSGTWEFLWGGAIDVTAGTVGGELIATLDYDAAADGLIDMDALQATNYMIRIVWTAATLEVRIMGDAFPIAVFNNSKELHHYKVEWKTGNILLYIDDVLVDTRYYNAGADFYLDKLIFHVGVHGSGGASGIRAFNVVFGAQCSNEADFKEGCLNIVAGGTIEQEGMTGHLLTRNEGTFFLDNAEDDWSWEKMLHWKTLALNASSEPDMDNARELQRQLIEYGKDTGGDWYTMLHNPVNRNYHLHAGQVGPVNADMETYGKFFSLFGNDSQRDYLQLVMNLFDVYTFTHGLVDDLFQFSILGLNGSLMKLLAPYAMQQSQIADAGRDLNKSIINENKTGYNLLKAFDDIGLRVPYISEDKTRLMLGLFSERKFPTQANLISFVSDLYGINEEYIQIEERENLAEVYIPILFPQPDGVFERMQWFQRIQEVISLFRTGGITYVFDAYRIRLLATSENASGNYIGTQVTIV